MEEWCAAVQRREWLRIFSRLLVYSQEKLYGFKIETSRVCSGYDQSYGWKLLPFEGMDCHSGWRSAGLELQGDECFVRRHLLHRLVLFLVAGQLLLIPRTLVPCALRSGSKRARR